MLFLSTTGGEGVVDDVPSFFEMFMQERVVSEMRPAALHVATVLSEVSPRLIFLVQRFDEVFALFSLALERRFLWVQSATFAEYFYGLVRRRGGGGGALTSGDRWRSLFCAVALPYFKRKLDRLLHEREEERGVFVRAYPAFHVAYEGSFFLYQWCYLFGFTKYFSPVLRALNTVVVHQPPPSHATAAAAAVAPPTTWAARLQAYTRVALVLAVVGFKAAEWWHSADRRTATANITNAGGVPNPPHPPAAAPGGVPLPQDKELCPLCRKPRANPVLSSAGFVFCYRCLLPYVREHHRCPVSHQPCDEGEILRIFGDAS